MSTLKRAIGGFLSGIGQGLQAQNEMAWRERQEEMRWQRDMARAQLQEQMAMRAAERKEALDAQKPDVVVIDGVAFDKRTQQPLFESLYDKIIPGEDGKFYRQKRLGIGRGVAGSAAPDDGLMSPGNIDLSSRPIVRNPDGSISTVRSISIGTDAGEVLIPTISDDGRALTDDEAVAQFQQSGRHLGIFKTPAAATAYAEQLHRDQERMYAGSSNLGPQADGSALITPEDAAKVRESFKGRGGDAAYNSWLKNNRITITGQGGGSSGPVRPASKEEFDRLPSGTEFLAPDGTIRRKP